MITCKKCKSTNVKISNLNFARVMPEGHASAKHTYNKYGFYCNDCNEQWLSNPEAESIYSNYKMIRSRTALVANDMGVDGSYGPSVELDEGDMRLQSELAKKLFDSYRHTLNLDPGEWYAIELDSKI